MTLDSVSPCTETEIQPSYSQIWKEWVLDRFECIEDFEPINSSILRSMLVMDLMDCNFLKLDTKYKKRIYDWYHIQIMSKYTNNSDIFSLRYNIPDIYVSIPLNDYYYFKSDDIVIVKLLTILLKCCYKKFGDIFADNGYEVTGPIYRNKKTYLIYTISNILPKSVTIMYVNEGIVEGIVDMFGHSSLQFNKPSYICLYDNIPIFEDDILKLIGDVNTIYDNLSSHTIMTCISSRIFRFKNIFSTENSLSLYNNIVPNISLSDRITDTKQLIKLIQID